MCFDRISFADPFTWPNKSPVTLAEARRGIRKEDLPRKEATSSTRLDRHDPQTILSCLTSLWAPHLHTFWRMNCSRRSFLPDGRSCQQQKSHLRCKGKATWLPKSTRKLHASCKDWRYVFKFLHPPRRKYLFCRCFLIEKGSRAGGIPNQHQPWRFDEKKISDGHSQVGSAFMKKQKGWWMTRKKARYPVKKSCKVSHGRLRATCTQFIERSK